MKKYKTVNKKKYNIQNTKYKIQIQIYKYNQPLQGVTATSQDLRRNASPAEIICIHECIFASPMNLSLHK